MLLLKATSILLMFAPLVVLGANADDFFCRTTYCVIPYDGQGIQNGLEVCYADIDKKEKAKEVTWKNGLRQGPARCFEKGKIKIEANFEKNRLHGLYVEKDHDSTGDHHMRVIHGRQEGFAFSIDREKKMNFRGCWQDGAMSELAEKDCLKGDYGPYTKQVLAEFKAIKEKEKLSAAEEKARRDGPQTEKFPDGSVRAQYKNKNGQTVGPYQEFHRNGKPAAERNYSSEGKLDGEAKEWNEQGVLKKRIVYKAGIKTSETEFRDNGQPHLFVIWEGEGFDRSPCLTYYFESGKKQSSECRLPSLSWYEPPSRRICLLGRGR